MNTSRRRVENFLVPRVSAHRSELLLVEWANTTTEYPQLRSAELGASGVRAFTVTETAAVGQTDAAISRLMKRYPEVFSSLAFEPPPPADTESKIATSHWWTVAPIQQFLRLAWQAPTLREREWYIFKARDSYHHSTVVAPLFDNRMRAAMRAGADLKQELENPMPDEEFAARTHPPALTPFEQVMYHFHRIADRARHCSNPECPAPYFFAKKKGQKYCSSKCSAPAQREQKRDWWRRNRAKLKD